MEQRKFDRFGFRAEALITHNDVTFKGEVEDLSLRGLFVKTEHPLAVDDTVSVAINFDGTDEKFSFSIPATVVRTTETGIGLSFKRIDVDSVLSEKKNEAAEGRNRDVETEEFETFVGRGGVLS